MKSFALVAAIVVLVGLAAFGVACKNGGGGLSLEEYFTQLDAAQNEVDRQFDEAFQLEEPGPDTSEEDIAAFARQVAEVFSTIFEDAEGTFGDIEPPAQAEEAHNALVQAIGDIRTAIDDVVDNIPDALSLEEMDAILGAPEVETASNAVDDACKELQQIADDNSIDVDLECEDE